MELKLDVEKIFLELKKEYTIEKDKKESIQMPEDISKIEEIFPSDLKQSEAVHGGGEASNSIKNSPNASKKGEETSKDKKIENKEKETSKDKKIENKEKEISKDKKAENKEKETLKDKKAENKEKETSKDKKAENKEKETSKDKKVENKEKETSKDKKTENNKEESSKEEELENKEEISKEKRLEREKIVYRRVKKIFLDKKQRQEEYIKYNREKYTKKYILEIIKKVAAEHAGIDKQDGVETFDKKKMLEHILKKESIKILGDKYDLKDARYVQFFIDTSGVYGCGSNKILHEMMPEIISLLERQGYECYIAACANGFYSRDMEEDSYYNTRKTLLSYKAGKVSKIACPTPKTAATMANEAEFSIILADFDGLSSICEMAQLCQPDKVPYFLSSEDRYPWEDPTLHDWVNPKMCKYDLKLVYDVSLNGNPTLEQYKSFEENQEYEEYGDYYDR